MCGQVFTCCNLQEIEKLATAELPAWVESYDPDAPAEANVPTHLEATDLAESAPAGSD